MIGRRAISMMPEQVSKTRRRRADICVRIVAVNAPGLQRSLHDEIVAGAANVIHDFFAALFLKSFADARAESFQHLVPCGSRPLSSTSWAVAFHRIQDAIGVVNLRNRGRTLSAKASAARWMFGIAFKLGDLPSFFIDIGEKSAGRFAVEAYRRNEVVMFLDATRPGCGI